MNICAALVYFSGLVLADGMPSINDHLPDSIKEKLSVKAELRYRLEYRDNFDFNDTVDDEDGFHLLRIRVQIEYKRS